MRKRIFKTILAVLLALLILPVIVKQLIPRKSRSFTYVRLEETNYREISFRNEMQDLNLGGMLFVPSGSGPFPAVVIIHGSGTSQRDNGWYLTLTHYLKENGIVVLLPDKRGSEKSEGDWRNSSFEDLATDTHAAISWLKEQDQVNISYTGIIGMSQGGHIAPLAASESKDISFVINIVGGAIPKHQVLYYEENNNLKEMGFLPGFSNLIAILSTYEIRNSRQKEFWQAVGNFDPLPYWQKINIPAIVLYGENDTNVPSQESAERLRSLDNPNIKVRIFENSGHALETPEGEGTSIFREDALRTIRDFIIDIGK